METTFTKWTYTKGAKENSFVISEKDEVLADNICIINSSRYDAEQSAKIISAAPEMLEALLIVSESGLPEWKHELISKVIKKATE